MFAAIGKSIRLRVMFLMIAAAFVALLFTAISLVIFDTAAFKEARFTDLVTQASLVGQASAPALAFDDQPAAQNNLGLLSVRPRILAAAIYTSQGMVFASYARPGAAASPPEHAPAADGFRVSGDRAILTQGIQDATGRLGTIYLEASYGLIDRVRAYIAIMGAVLLASLMVAAVASYRLQEAVTAPLLEITDVSRQVQARRDYSLRVRKTSNDEIGELVETFNDMLSEVGQRTAALEETNRTLEREMTIRHGAEQALLAADQRKDEFLATLAHELRNPMAPLRNALEIMRRSPGDAARLETAQEIMNRQLRQLVRLVDDLLDVSRITTGKLKIQRERVDLNSIIESALDMAKPHLDAKRIQFTVTVPREPIYLDADPTRLSQVFLNLLHNAAKFTAPEGRVDLSAEVADGILTATVADSGIGIPRDKLPEIFDMFAQLDRSLDRAYAGLGVGLSLARRFVELHGGTLEAQSEGPGRGSQFVVRLPIVTAASPEAGVPGAVASNGETPQRRILIADDNEDFVDTFTMLLRSMGHEVYSATQGEEALDAAASLHPEIAFLDLGLPKLDGYALARKIRAMPQGPTTVLVAITGWGQQHDKTRAQEAGFDHHLVKPVDISTIQAILESAFPGA
jgi:signal transduction histidine kinase/ActR/RegA family two-component response regulator